MAEAPGDLPTEAGLDADLGGRLDSWGSLHRLGLSGAGLLLSALLLREAGWLLFLLVGYFAASGLAFWLVNERRSVTFKARGRVALLVLDVMVVSTVAYAWGTHTSPAVLMYLPIVVGFTLMPQKHLGRLALLFVLCVVGTLLVLEETGQLPHAPYPAHQSAAREGRLLFFALLATSLAAVQGLVEYTVERVREHRRVVTQLMAERERQKHEAQLAQQIEETARLESLGRLSGGVAHDFNNLLMALLGYAELARARVYADPAFVEQSLQDIERAAEHGRELTAQLLDFASRRPARPRTLELNQAVSTAIKLLTRLLRQSVRLELQCAGQPCWVRIDPGSLERVLLNLAINASDAMPEGGTLSVRVERDPARPETWATVTVADQGVGIAEHDLPHIFEPFFTRKERGKGTGLGLASVYGIVRQNQGEIEVRSQPGCGTTFHLGFPLTTPEPSEPAPAKPALRSPSAARVLVVDDNDWVREVVQRQLEDAGYRATAVDSGSAALERLAHAPYDVLVSDVVMPGMSGVELATQARAAHPGLAIVLISGFTEPLSAETRSSLGVELLDKPFSTEQLLAALQRAASLHS